MTGRTAREGARHAPPAAAPIPEPGTWLTSLPTDWLPRVLMAGDALVAAASVLIAYWYRHNLDFINPRSQNLLLPPYVAAVPVATFIYCFALFINRQYRSWRGQTLVDQLLSLYSGIGLG